MRRAFTLAVVTAALAVSLAIAPAGAAAPSDEAACVGQFSRFFAHGGGDTHRSDLAQDFAHNARPAGLNVYSHYAMIRGSLEDCFAA